jgi:ATP-dependent DNA helicase RecQ
MTTSSGRASREGGRTPSPPADPVAELARSRFGVPYLYPVQRFVVSNTLEGASQIVVLPTGSGKSLCFQLAGLLLDGPTLVLVPLRSLAADQLRRLEASGVAAAALRGGQEPEEREALFAAVAAGRVRIVIATPEACLVAGTLRRLAALSFRHLVVDEAHCVADWGDRFRPSYLALGALARAIGAPVVTAFTATASEPVLRRIREALLLGGDTRLVAGDPDRPNIRYAVLPVLARTRAVEAIARSRPRPLLVFCRTRDGAEVLARELERRRAGRAPAGDVLFYHAGLDRAEREAVERRFLPSTDAILCATSAYGMGVDKPDIRTVVHADVPASIEAYLQETGRAGRDGRPSEAVLLVSREDDRFRQRLGAGPERDRLDRMIVYARTEGACRRRTLLAMIGQQLETCAGCDVCDGRAAAAAPGEREILEFIARHPRRFRAERAAEVLAGQSTPRIARGFLDGLRGFGDLAGWERADIEEAIRELAALGRLRLAGWPWHGALASPAGNGQRRGRLPD